MERSEVVDRLAREQLAAEKPAPTRDPAAEAQAERLEATTEELRASARQVAPAFDAAVRDLDQLRGEIGRIPAHLEELRRTMPAPSYAVLERRARESAEADADRRAAAARRQLEAAREEVLASLIPEPARHADRDHAERELAEELELHDDPIAGMPALVRQYLEAGDEYAVRVLAGSWGRRRFLKAGGTAEGWPAFRLGMLAPVAERATTAAEKRRWAFVLGRDPDKLLDILHAKARWAAER